LQVAAHNAKVWAAQNQQLRAQLIQAGTDLAVAMRQRDGALGELRAAKELRNMDTKIFLDKHRQHVDAMLHLREELANKNEELVAQQEMMARDQERLSALLAEAQQAVAPAQLDDTQVRCRTGVVR
jgi:multidrug resistance efflux pump